MDVLECTHSIPQCTAKTWENSKLEKILTRWNLHFGMHSSWYVSMNQRKKIFYDLKVISRNIIWPIGGTGKLSKRLQIFCGYWWDCPTSVGLISYLPHKRFYKIQKNKNMLKAVVKYSILLQNSKYAQNVWNRKMEYYLIRYAAQNQTYVFWLNISEIINKQLFNILTSRWSKCRNYSCALRSLR